MSTQPKPKYKGSVLGSVLSLPFRILGWLLLTWLIAVFIFSLIFIIKGHAAGFNYCSQIFGKELVHFSAEENAKFIIVQKLKYLNEQISSINNLSGSLFLRKFIRILYPVLADYLQAVISITGIVIIRIITSVRFIPLMLLLGIVGLINGVVQRYLRRINGGRESALIYHYAKASIKAFSCWGSLLYIVFPCYIEPARLLLPFIIVSSASIYLTAKMFKKYS